MKDLVIIGAGGFGREVYAWLWDVFDPAQYRFKGFLDRNPDALANQNIEAPVLGDPESYRPAESDRLILAIGGINGRRRIIDNFTAWGADGFADFVHPTALITATATIGKGAVIFPYATISNNACLGDFVHLSLYASVSHDAVVGDNCNLCPYATVNGGGVVEEDCFLATHSIVAPLKRLGRGSTVSACTPVLQDTPPNSFVFANKPKTIPNSPFKSG